MPGADKRCSEEEVVAELRSGMSPAINAISTVVLLVTAALGLWAERGTRRLKGTRS